jgi:secreted trypsin-like serine protease
VRKAGKGEIPFLVAIVNANRHTSSENTILCTGALISYQDVLTAAHCVNNRLLNNTEVIAGANDVRSGKRYRLIGWLTYNTWAITKNIALMYEINDIVVLRVNNFKTLSVLSP